MLLSWKSQQVAADKARATLAAAEKPTEAPRRCKAEKEFLRQRNHHEALLEGRREAWAQAIGHE